MPIPLTTQTTQLAQPLPANSQTSQPDPFWSVVGQYGVGLAALLAILKAYADYQLKAAMEDRALRLKEGQQGLELEGRVFGSLLSQQESSVKSTGELLNTFIAKTLNQAEVNSEQTSSLIDTIGVLTESIRVLGETQQSQTAILYELKEYSESHTTELAILHEFRQEIISTLELNTALINQVLALMEKLITSTANTNINAEGQFMWVEGKVTVKRYSSMVGGMQRSYSVISGII